MPLIPELFNLTNRTIVITGGTGVLGREIALALARVGAHVAVLSRNPSRAADLIHQASEAKGKLIAIAADVVEKQSLVQAEEQIRQTFGRIDALINAAGGNSPKASTNKEHSFFQLGEDGMREVADLNFLGTLLPCQVFGKPMAEQKEGVILNVTSVSALKPLTRVPVYAAAKAAVKNFTEWLAVYMAQEYSPNIRVNALAPGFFLTEQNRFLLTDEKTGELTERGKKIIEHTPMGRFGEPKDLVGTVFWLLSPASGFVTGTVIYVDGGFTAYAGV